MCIHMYKAAGVSVYFLHAPLRQLLVVNVYVEQSQLLHIGDRDP